MPAAKALLISSAILVLLSWFRAFIAGTLMVDGHGLHGATEVFIFLAILFCLGFFSFAYYRLWLWGELDLGQIKILALVLSITFSFMLPMFSNDIFSYMVFGDAANSGADVYTNAQCTHMSVFYPYITGMWTSSTCAYGPVVLMLAMFAAYLSAGKILLALVIYKLLVLLFSFAFIEMAARLCALLQSPVRCFVFVVLNPVFLMQGVGQLHADLIAVTFVLSAVYFLLSNKWYLVFALVALSIATKMNYVLMVPFFIVGLSLQNLSPAQLYSRIGFGSFIGLIALAVAYFPFYSSIATITSPFTFHFFQNPSKCIGEILGYVIYFAPQIISGHKEQLNGVVNASSVAVTQVFISEIIVKICQLFALGASVYILLRFMRGERNLKQWFRVYVRALLLFLLFYLHIFNAWYLMLFLPFMWADEEPAFMHWLFVLTCFISVQDIVCAISRDSIVYIAELVLTFISVMIYMYKPRHMFFASLGY